jgi:hypothetical protein
MHYLIRFSWRKWIRPRFLSEVSRVPKYWPAKLSSGGQPRSWAGVNENDEGNVWFAISELSCVDLRTEVDMRATVVDLRVSKYSIIKLLAGLWSECLHACAFVICTTSPSLYAEVKDWMRGIVYVIIIQHGWTLSCEGCWRSFMCCRIK